MGFNRPTSGNRHTNQMISVRIMTKPDVNGNSRNAFVIMADDGQIVEVVKHMRDFLYPNHLVVMSELETYVAPKEYRRILKLKPNQGKQ